jgi:hypothetical protein
MSDEIPDGAIESMCLTWRHDFGLPHVEPTALNFVTGSGPTTAEREALRRDMRQLYLHHVLPAILAERERCAKIAERDGNSHDATLSQQTAEWRARVNAEVRAADRIASSIRSSHE